MVYNWVSRTGVSLDMEKRTLKTTKIFQNTFNVQLPLQSI